MRKNEGVERQVRETAGELLGRVRRGRERPALVLAAEAGDASLARELLRQGCLVDECSYWRDWGNKRTWNADTALIAAVRWGQVDIVKLALSAGANLDAQSCWLSGVAETVSSLVGDSLVDATLVAAEQGWTRASHSIFGPKARAALVVAMDLRLPEPVLEHALSFLGRRHWLEGTPGLAAHLVGGAVCMPRTMVQWISLHYFYCDTLDEWQATQRLLKRRVLSVRNSVACEWATINWHVEPLVWTPRPKPSAKLRLDWRHGDWWGPWPPPSPPECSQSDSPHLFVAQDTDLVWCGFYIHGVDWLLADKHLRAKLAIPGCFSPLYLLSSTSSVCTQ